MGMRSWLTWLVFLWNCFHVEGGSTFGFNGGYSSISQAYEVTCPTGVCGTQSIVLTISRTGSTLTNLESVSVSTRSYTITSMSANATVDYTPLDGSIVVFNPGESSNTISLSVLTSGQYMTNCYFEVYLSTSVSGSIIESTRSSVFIAILGSVGTFSFSSSNYTFLETDGVVNIPIVRSNGACGAVTLYYALENQASTTAILGTNFVLDSPTLSVTFQDGQTSANLSINIIHTPVYEFYSLFLVLNLVAPTDRGQLGSTISTRVFIADAGDAGIFQFTSAVTYCREDNGTAIVWIERTVGSSTSSVAPVLLTVETITGGNASEGASRAFDFQRAYQVLSWADGELTKSFSVTIFNNAVYEPRVKSIWVGMTGVSGGASITSSLRTTIINIVDDRDAGTLSFETFNYTVREDATSVSVVLKRSGEPDALLINNFKSGSISVDVSTYNGLIVPGLPFNDPGYDYDVATLLRCTHLSPCTASASQHYTAVPTTTITFQDGEDTKTITILILNNDLYEAPSRIFKVIMSNVQGGAHIGWDTEHPVGWDRLLMLPLDPKPNLVPNYISTIVTILDDGDPAVLLSKASTSTSELGQSDSYSIRLNSPPSAPVVVSIAINQPLVTLSTNQAIFTSSTWSVPQIIRIVPLDDNITQGIHTVQLSHASTSTDPGYNGGARLTVSGSGVVFSRGIYTAVTGNYDQGNAQHEFRWSDDLHAVKTAPSTPIINNYIFDNDFASIQIKPETVRHALDTPKNFVCVRRNGHVASITLTLSSEPTANVVLNIQPTSSSVLITPSSVTITPSLWQSGVAVSISYTGTLSTVSTSSVHITSTSSDPFYTAKTTDFFVHGYNAAEIDLHETPSSCQESGVTSRTTYTVAIASEPMHWEPPPKVATPFKLAVLPTDDISASSNYPPENGEYLYVASNGTESTNSLSVSKLAVLKFSFKDAREITASGRAGLALLRLYRIQGGDNLGLGGLQIGVATTSAISWLESTCDTTCISSILPVGIPFGSAQSNRGDLASVVDIVPQGRFNTTTSVFQSEPNWIEIDVTSAWNAASSTADKDSITFILYALRETTFVYDNIDEMQFASKDHHTATLRPHIRLTASGAVNLAQIGSASQSSGSLNASQVLVSGGLTTMTGTSWWRVDWQQYFFIESIVLMLVVPTPQSFEVNVDIGTSTRVFQVATTLPSQPVNLIWHVYGENGTIQSASSFQPNMNTFYEAISCVVSSNRATYYLQRVQVFQVPMASTRISIGGYLPSPSVNHLGLNEIQLVPEDMSMADASQCHDNQICRNELLFTSGQWALHQPMRLVILDNNVATGNRTAGISHTSFSRDPDYDSVVRGLCTLPTCSSPIQKTFRFIVEDDDEAGVVFSTNSIELIEGALNYPGAPIPVVVDKWQPLGQPRCSWNFQTKENTSCVNAFKGTLFTACLEPNANLFSNGSSWVLLQINPMPMILREIRLQMPSHSVRSLKTISVWTSNNLDLNASSWEKLETQTLPFGETQVAFNQVTTAKNYIALHIEASYDVTSNCVDISLIELWGDIRRDSAPVSISRLSKTHQQGQQATIAVRLLSEPLTEVVVNPLLTSMDVISYDRLNSSGNAISRNPVIGGRYSYATFAANLPTALHFNASNWNQAQILEFSAVDDNIFKSNRTVSISYTSTSDDNSVSFYQVDVATSIVSLLTTPLPSASRYHQTKFIISDTLERDRSWPYHTLSNLPTSVGSLSITAAIIDDDLPGITISTAPVVVVERDPVSSNYSIVLDTEPTSDVTLQLSVQGFLSTANPSLVSIDPKSISFSSTNWYIPQYISITAPYTSSFEGNVSSTMRYGFTVPKKNSELKILHISTSLDGRYNALALGTNDKSAVYYQLNAVPLVVNDIDTGCVEGLEYSCANGQSCIVDPLLGNRCNCTGIYGMRDCTAECSSGSVCAFSRIKLLLSCKPGVKQAICSTAFTPYRLIQQLQMMLQGEEFRSADGVLFSKLQRESMETSLYIVSAIETLNPITGTPSMEVLVDLIDTPPFNAVSKLYALYTNGFMSNDPFYATSFERVGVIPLGNTASILLWVFVGVIAIALVVGGSLFLRKRELQVNHETSMVMPNALNDPNDLIHETMGM